MTNPPQNPGGPQWGSAPNSSQPQGSPAPQYGQSPAGNSANQPPSAAPSAPSSPAGGPQGSPAPASPYGSQPVAAPPKKGGATKWIIGGCGCLLLLVIGLIVALLALGVIGNLANGDGEGDQTPTSAPTTSEPASDPSTTESETPATETESESPTAAADKPSKQEYKDGIRTIMIEDQGMSEDLINSPEVQPYFTCLTDESYERVSPEGARKIANGDPNISVSDSRVFNDAIEACNDELGV